MTGNHYPDGHNKRFFKLKKYIYFKEAASIIPTAGDCKIYKGYYTSARRYEFYVRVARTMSHE